MQSSAGTLGADQAQQACASCKMRKRRCDKGVPKCSACTKKHITCDYSRSDQDTNSLYGSWPSASSIEQGRRDQCVDFPTLLFLDPRILQHGQVDAPGMTIVVPTHILQLVGDITEVRITASKFFKTVHPWMPFISKKRFYDHHLYPLSYSRADISLLFLCMKLITELPPEAPRSPQSSLYYAAKHFFQEVESSGMFNIHVLQAGVLLSLYELGHAIYPSAYLTIGACARFAYALGINGNAMSQTSKALTLVELEERRRVWWAVVILDRFVSIGCPGRPFATEDPKPHELLPADDVAWDRGYITADDLFTLSSPLSGHMSKFALLCQAARLLGQVLNHVSSDIVDQLSYDQEQIQLDRTINAMIAASESLESPDYDQIAFAYCTLTALQEPWISSSNANIVDRARCQRARAAMEKISMTIVESLPGKIPCLGRKLESASPWGLCLAYQAYITYMRLSRETGRADAAEAMGLLNETLTVLDTRWRAAGAYLQLVEARKAMGIV